MYYDYFGLSQPPFRITPDPSLFYPGGNRGAVLDALIYAIVNGEGIVKVVGEVGSGKTMLCRMLEKELPDRVEIVYLANPSVAPENILHAIAFELKLPVQSNTSRLQVMHQLQQYLLRQHGENRQVVVFVEEAQGMPIETLEEIRLLSNLETRQSKLLQIVLFGQPELDQRISRPDIRQLKERITYSFSLEPFATDDIRDYLNSRLRTCGYRAGDLFTNAAVARIGRYSQGLVRRINILADKSLLAAYAANTHTVDVSHVRRAARDSEFINHSRRNKILAAGLAALVLLAAIPAAWWMLRDPPAAPPGIGNLDTGLPAALDPGPASPVVAPPAGDMTVTGAPGAAPGPAGPESPAAPRADLPAAPSGEPGMTGDGPSSSSGADPGAGIANLPGAAAADTGAGGLAAEAGGEATSPLAQQDLLGVGAVFNVQDFTDSRLTPAESSLLRRQLAVLPPEGARLDEPLSPGDVCEVCWSIVYRPLNLPENL